MLNDIIETISIVENMPSGACYTNITIKDYLECIDIYSGVDLMLRLYKKPIEERPPIDLGREPIFELGRKSQFRLVNERKV